MPLERGITTDRLRHLRDAKMSIQKVERSLRPDGSVSDLYYDVAYDGTMQAYADLELRAATAHVSLIRPRPARA